MKSFRIGDVLIDPPLVFAPLAGLSHSPMRQLVTSFKKPGLFYTEMLSSKSLKGESFESSIFLKAEENEHPITYQIFSADEADAVSACSILNEGCVDIIDLNLSCPAPEISKKRKAGAYLLSDLKTTEKILKEMRKAISCPFTVKIRLGIREDKGFLNELGTLVEECGVDAVILHPRTTREKLKRHSRWSYIGYLKSILSIPVIGNGDVTSGEACFRMFEETGCDGVMIGRAAVQKPWIFSEILGTEYDLSPYFLKETYLRGFRLMTEFFPPEKALVRMKEFTWYFTKNMKFGHFFASKIQSSSTLSEMEHHIDMAFDNAC